MYDIDAAGAQRAEAAGLEPFQFTLRGATYHWPAELPAELLGVAAKLTAITDDASPEAAGAIQSLFRALSGDRADELIRQMSVQDLIGVVQEYVKHTSGSGLGESQGSPASSPRTPRPRKPTSKRRTGSTSSTTTAAT